MAVSSRGVSFDQRVADNVAEQTGEHRADPDYGTKPKVKKGMEEKKPCWITKQISEDYDRETFLRVSLIANVIFLVFVILVVTCAVMRTKEDAIKFNKAMIGAFAQSGFRTPVLGSDSNATVAITFEDIRSAADFWAYMFSVLDTLYPDCFQYDDKNSSKCIYPAEKDDKKVLFENIILGVPRLRQVKVKNDSCAIHNLFRSLFLSCFDLYSEQGVDREAFGPRNSTAWVYDDEAGTGSRSYSGKFSTYGGGGYYVDLGTNKEDSYKIIDDLYRNLWITRGTRAVFLDFSVYNANMDLFCICKLIFEFPPTGGVLPFAQFLVQYLDVGPHGDYKVVFIIECVIYIYSVYYFCEEIREIVYLRWRYLLQFWSYMDLIQLLCLIGVFLTSVVYFPKLTKVLDKIYEDPKKYGNMEYISYIKRTNEMIYGFLTFFSLLKCFQYININKYFGQVNDTLKRCVGDVLCFTVMFFIIFCAFSELAYILFGSQVYAFSSFGRSMLSLLRTLLGDFHYEEIERANRFMAPIFFLAYIFLVYFVLLNMFLAIITDTYSDVKTGISLGVEEMQMTDYIRLKVYKLLQKIGLKKDALVEGKVIASYVLKEIKESFLKCGFNNEEIQMFFDRVNPGHKLTNAALVEALEAEASKLAEKNSGGAFVRLNDFLAHQFRLERVEQKTLAVAQMFDYPISQVDAAIRHINQHGT